MLSLNVLLELNISYIMNKYLYKTLILLDSLISFASQALVAVE